MVEKRKRRHFFYLPYSIYHWWSRNDLFCGLNPMSFVPSDCVTINKFRPVHSKDDQMSLISVTEEGVTSQSLDNSVVCREVRGLRLTQCVSVGGSRLKSTFPSPSGQRGKTISLIFLESEILVCLLLTRVEATNVNPMESVYLLLLLLLLLWTVNNL